MRSSSAGLSPLNRVRGSRSFPFAAALARGERSSVLCLRWMRTNDGDGAARGPRGSRLSRHQTMVAPTASHATNGPARTRYSTRPSSSARPSSARPSSTARAGPPLPRAKPWVLAMGGRCRSPSPVTAARDISSSAWQGRFLRGLLTPGQKVCDPSPQSWRGYQGGGRGRIRLHALVARTYSQARKRSVHSHTSIRGYTHTHNLAITSPVCSFVDIVLIMTSQLTKHHPLRCSPSDIQGRAFRIQSSPPRSD